MQSRGFDVSLAENIGEAETIINEQGLNFAVLDMRLEFENGLQLIEPIKRSNPDCKVVILTSYGNLTSAVTAIKSGAVDYLSKPADADDVTAALLSSQCAETPIPKDMMSANRVKWEHILRIYELCGRNISETARRLKMHRRTLQRILQKHAPY